MKKIVVLAGLVLCIQSCSYAISPAMRSQADKTITFDMIAADAETFKGKIVILGGVIAKLENTKEGTIIEVIEKPLDYWEEPRRTDKTGGRFLVLYHGYLDSFIYATGREITVAGEIDGTYRPAISDPSYKYPLIISRELKLWEKPRYFPRQEVPFGEPLYDPYAPRNMTW